MQPETGGVLEHVPVLIYNNFQTLCRCLTSFGEVYEVWSYLLYPCYPSIGTIGSSGPAYPRSSKPAAVAVDDARGRNTPCRMRWLRCQTFRQFLFP
ncbi:unnamed protein product [Pleuronectes platessa]|uniref:Uncharacterized protein n=1 Tax=Pleuronectes platessa TaxID=8262 RepID=A0A9N7UZP7_PLEPL|nr:unnamed protein product [Pleuronectes platessa]